MAGSFGLGERVMAKPAAYMTVGGISWSWYCSRCLKELGVDLDDKDGEPSEGCPEHGVEYLASESWSSDEQD